MQVFLPNVGDRRRVLLETPPDLWTKLPKGLDRQCDAGCFKSGRYVHGLSEHVVSPARPSANVAGGYGPEVHLDHKPTLPAVLDHELIRRVLELKQPPDAAIHSLRRKHRQDGIPDEFHNTAACGVYR